MILNNINWKLNSEKIKLDLLRSFQCYNQFSTLTGLSQLTQTFGGTGGFSGSCGGPAQNGYGGYGGGGGGQQGGGQHGAPAWIHDRDVHNLIENVSKGSDKEHKEQL